MTAGLGFDFPCPPVHTSHLERGTMRQQDQIEEPEHA